MIPMSAIKHRVTWLVAVMLLVQLCSAAIAEALLTNRETNPTNNTSQPVANEAPVTIEPVNLNYVWVPKGSLQVHLDFIHNRSDNDASLWSLPQAWLRYGVTDKLQAVLKPPNYKRVGLPRGTGSAIQGWESIYTGVQYNLDDKPGGIDMAVEGGVWSPTRSDGLDFRNVVPEGKLYLQSSLPKNSWIYGELPMRVVETSPRTKFEFEPFVIAGHVIRSNTSLFVIYKGFWFENIRNSHELGGGISYNFTPVTQMNLYSGFGVGPGSPKFHVGVFLSQRFDGLAKCFAKHGT